eukprot:3291_1
MSSPRSSPAQSGDSSGPEWEPIKKPTNENATSAPLSSSTLTSCSAASIQSQSIISPNNAPQLNTALLAKRKPPPVSIGVPTCGAACAHHTQPSLYKTELCRSFQETGMCRYGAKCQFAHGMGDLRPIIRHRKYKTEPCRNYQEKGECPYGPRCRFIHDESENQLHELNCMNSGNPCSVHVQGEEGSTPGSGHGSHAAHYRHPADPPHMSHGRCNCGARGQYSGVRAYFKDEGHAMLRRHSSPDGCCAMRSGDCSVMHAAPRPLTRHRHNTHAGDRFVMDRHAPHAPPLPLAFYDQIENVDMNAREFHEMEARDLCGCADCTRVSVRSHRAHSVVEPFDVLPNEIIEQDLFHSSPRHRDQFLIPTRSARTNSTGLPPPFYDARARSTTRHGHEHRTASFDGFDSHAAAANPFGLEGASRSLLRSGRDRSVAVSSRAPPTESLWSSDPLAALPHGKAGARARSFGSAEEVDYDLIARGRNSLAAIDPSRVPDFVPESPSAVAGSTEGAEGSPTAGLSAVSSVRAQSPLSSVESCASGNAAEHQQMGIGRLPLFHGLADDVLGLSAGMKTMSMKA